MRDIARDDEPFVAVRMGRVQGDRASKLRSGSTSEYGALCQAPTGACGGSENAACMSYPPAKLARAELRTCLGEAARRAIRNSGAVTLARDRK